MLIASDWNPTQLDWPVYVQPKYNGTRATYQDGKFYSRDGIENNSVPHLNEQMREVIRNTPRILDGELYCHGMSLQEINGITNPNRTTVSPDAHKIRFIPYDTFHPDIPSESFRTRLAWMVDNLPAIAQTVATTLPAAVDIIYQKHLADRYEGAVIRATNGRYEPGRRAVSLQKRKPWYFEHGKIVGFVEGEGKFKGSLGVIQLNWRNRIVNVGRGELSDLQADDIWASRSKFFGKRAQFRYPAVSLDGQPVQAQLCALATWEVES